MVIHLLDPWAVDAGTALRIERICPICLKPFIVVVDVNKYDRWRSGEYIQNVWPDTPPSVRELMKTGIDGACFDIIMAEDE